MGPKKLRVLAALAGTGGVLSMAASFSFQGAVSDPVPVIFGLAGAVNCLVAALLLAIARQRLGDEVRLPDQECVCCREAKMIWCGDSDSIQAAEFCSCEDPDTDETQMEHHLPRTAD